MAAATKTPSKDSKSKKTIGATELAEQIGTSPTELRKFLRSKERKVGRGKRYQFNSKEAQAVKASWKAAHKAE